jgi:excinuclease UvrABC nuclease subunit
LYPGEENSGVSVASGWPKEYPNSSRKGVYAIFGRTGKLLYIGKASMNHYIGSRLGAYFRYEKLTRACEPIHNGWRERPSYIATVAVPDNMSFEAPALEEYLIQRLNPSHNAMGLSRSNE